MYLGKSFLAIIPARSGSKGIPGKNIREVNGKPLINYTIEEANKSKYLDKIIVSTDDKEIADVSLNAGAEVPFLRPKYLATDTAKTIDVLIDCLTMLKKNGETFDYIVLLQPTQPLRKSWHIDDAIKQVTEKNADSLVSVTEVKEHPILMRTINKEGHVENLLKTNSTLRRQEFPNFYIVNGAIYINKIRQLTSNTSLNDNKLAFKMEKEYHVDIDEPLDIEIFKHLLSIKH
jgi:CMP-N,N'-diacetyllegionaminic acid synthase